MNLTAIPPLADRLSLTFDALYRAVAARIARGAMTAAMILLVCRRVRRAEREILGLLARFEAGRLRVLAGPRAGGGGGEARAGEGGGGHGLVGPGVVGPGVAAARSPLGFAWLLPLVPGDGACFAGQLRTMLAEPAMVALLEASPQARRVLRPLCRMLGIERSMLRDVVEAVAGPALGDAAKVKRVRIARAPVDLGRIPLPRGVLTAARRQGFGRR
jgi:hypothetical protein